jgi:uncharacterized protein YuzE
MARKSESLFYGDSQRASSHRVSLDYDEEVDVLYVSFSDPPETPNDSLEGEDGVITHYATDGRVVGYTYLNASELLAKLPAA